MSVGTDYANAASQLLLEQGRARAQGLLGYGQAWSQGLQQLGQTIAAVPQQMQQQKAQALNQQVGQANLADIKAQTAQRQTAADLDAAAFARSQGYAKALTALTPQFTTQKPDGSFASDDEGLTAALTTAGYGDEAQKLYSSRIADREKLSKMATDADAHAKYVKSVEDQQKNDVADLIDDVNTPTEALNKLHAAVIAKALPADAAQTLADQITSSPDAWTQIKQSLLQASPARQAEAAKKREEMSKPVVLPQGGLLVDPATGKTVASSEPKPVLESKPMMLNGKQQPVNFNPRTGVYTMPGTGEDVSAKVQNVPTQAIVNLNQPAAGPMQVAAGSREERSAQDLADGKLTLAQLKTIYPYTRDGSNQQKMAAIYDKAREFNPNFNPADFEAGYKFATNPKVRQQIASINNVNSGVADLLKFSDAAVRSGVPLINQMALPGGVKLGSKTYANFQTARTAFADELSGALGYGSATDMSREMGFDMTDKNMSPDTFRSNVQDVVVPFVARKKASLLGQMGPYGGTDSAEGKTGNTTAPDLPPASHFAGMKPGSYDVPKPGGGTVRVIWDGTTVKGGG